MEVSQTRHWPRNSDRMSPPAHRAVCRLISRRPRLPTSGIVLRSPYWSEPTVWSLSLVVQHRYDDENLARQVTLPGSAFQARGAATAAVADRRAFKAEEGGSRCVAKSCNISRLERRQPVEARQRRALATAGGAPGGQPQRPRGACFFRVWNRPRARKLDLPGHGHLWSPDPGSSPPNPTLGRRSGALPQRSPAWAATGREWPSLAARGSCAQSPQYPQCTLAAWPRPTGTSPCHIHQWAWDPAAAAAQRRPHLTGSETRTGPGRRDPLAHAQPHSNFNLNSLAKSPPAPPSDSPSPRHPRRRALVRSAAAFVATAHHATHR
ncbi:hypothetical protein Purlil1_3750 [Purpureocillium lilacinum]|uniref:Uncharacterized protein n=1 Tax=Purpureocillium lilacinum TaxID=33203 RepID=A0ABR0C748_PURLI|nr:hypothetical protein Purlil1_3750 [Purpureocillium lilacinum]